MINPANFQDIKIVDLDTELTEPSQSGASLLRHMHLRLSETPSREWTEIFENERQFPRSSMWRDAWINGQHIVIDCVPEEIEQYHLRYLKEDVATTNKKYREYLERVRQAQEREQNQQAHERQQLDALKGRLDFS
jgi:hypothetical protein